MIPLGKPNIGQEEIDLVTEVLKSGWLAHGPKNKELEENFAKYIGVKNAISLNSCTSALQLAIQARGLQGEIIVPSFTFIASANSVITAGCKLVLADIEEETRNLDPESFRDKITDHTVGVMPVHYAGQSCRMKEIMEISEDKDLVVIEDSAESIGAEYNGRKTGSFGIGCFSFFPTKNMTTGEGGMLTTDDDVLADRVRTYRGHGISSSTWSREREKKPWLRAAIVPGYNYRLCDVLAAIGVEQLKKLDEMNDLRIKHAHYLTKNLNMDGIHPPVEIKEAKHVYQMYTILVDVDRTKFITKLRELGIGASVHFDPPIHLNPCYAKGYGKGDFPITEKVAESIVTLPMYPQLTGEDLDTMLSGVEKALKHCR